MRTLHIGISGTKKFFIIFIFSTISFFLYGKSFDEMGLYDLRSTIDYILGQTGNKKLTVITISMGAAVSCALLSSKPEYNEKITLLIALCPAVIFTHSMGKTFGLFSSHLRIAKVS